MSPSCPFKGIQLTAGSLKAHKNSLNMTTIFTHFAKPLTYRRFSFFLMALAALLFVFPSCKTDDFKDFDDATIVQEGAYAFPVGTVNFTLADLIENDTALTIGSDNGISLVYREDDFFSLSADEILDDLTANIDDSFSQEAKMGSVVIEGVAEGASVPFTSILDKFDDQNLISLIELNDGALMIIPPFEQEVLAEENIPPFAEYASMTVEEGSMYLTVKNNLFFDLEDFYVEVIDLNGNQLVGVFQFDYIAIGESKTSEIGLAGKTISNEFSIKMSTIKTPGSGTEFEMVDLDSDLEISFEVDNLIIKEGIVNLPEGVLAEDEMTFEFPTENGERMMSLQLDNALFDYEITSDMATDILVKMTFLDVTKNNVPISKEFTVSPTGTSGPITGTMDFSNTLWSLDNDASQPYNRIRATYEVSVPNGSNGHLAFSAEDEINIQFTLNEIEVIEAVGYFGFRQEQFEENTFDLGFDFSPFASGNSPLLFSDPAMRVEIVNTFGIPLQGEFNARAFGLYGEEANLNPPKIIINHPSMSEMGQSAKTVFVMNKHNSDLVEMLSVLPSYINYEGSATINPNSDPSALNFIHADSKLEASVELDLPFKFSAENLVYRDTSDAADLGLEQGGFTIEDIDSAEMKIVYDNGLPLMSTISLIALSDIGEETVVLKDVQFDAASVNADGKVPSNGAAYGETFIQLTNEQLLQLDNAYQYIYEIALKTTGDGQTPVAMYTDYRVEMGVGIRLVVSRGN